MTYKIEQAAVIGAGTMGAAIAAHLAYVRRIAYRCSLMFAIAAIVVAVSLIDDMEAFAVTGAQLQANEECDEYLGVPGLGARLRTDFHQTRAQGYRMAMHQLREMGLTDVAVFLDHKGANNWGDHYRVKAVEGE